MRAQWSPTNTAAKPKRKKSKAMYHGIIACHSRTIGSHAVEPVSPDFGAYRPSLNSVKLSKKNKINLSLFQEV
jgi:hypothetical protein